MRRFLLAFLLLMPLAWASNVTITSAVNGTDAFINARQNMTVFNVSLLASNITVTANITAINITLTGTANGTHIAQVSAFENSTAGTLLGINSSISPNLTSGQQIRVNFTTPLILSNNSRASILVLFEIHTNASVNSTIGGNLSGPGDILVNVTVVRNVSMPNSTLATIRNLRANATFSPNFADTAVHNQSFIYTIVPLGTESIKNVLVQLPSGLGFINITNVTVDGSNTTTGVSSIIDGALINVTTPAANTTQRIVIYFTANTSASETTSIAVPSFLYGGSISNFSTDVSGSTNITVRQMMNITNVTIAKSTAIVNGTDYWEFNFTIKFRGNSSSGGLVQFKLTNWTNSLNQNISLTNAAGASAICAVPNCATLRNETTFNTTGVFNVTNDYTMTKGITQPSINSDSAAINYVLRMVIPTGTPISSSWAATYGFLLRSIP